MTVIKKNHKNKLVRKIPKVDLKNGEKTCEGCVKKRMIQEMIEITVYDDGKLKDDREKAEELNFYLAFYLLHQGECSLY